MNLRFKFCDLRATGLVLVLAWTFTNTLVGQSAVIDWFTLDGGGGDNVGGVYKVSGTIGQTDIGTLSGGNYIIEGGFWPGVFSVPAPVPRLFIARSGDNAVIMWSPPTPGFVLQVSDGLAPTQWMDAASGNANPTTVSANLGHRFYRLLRR